MTISIDFLFNDATATLFQPIYDVRGGWFEVWALEALTRGPAGTHFEAAPILFDYIRIRREEVRADRWCVSAALMRHTAGGSPTRLSVNVHASTLERDPSFASFVAGACENASLDPSLLILELVEQAPYFDSSRVLRAVCDLRTLGVAIAIDDVGLGHANYRTILDVQPQYLKIDRYFVDGVSRDPRRHSLIRSALQIANDFGSLLIGEGVDDPADMAALREMGVPLLQGYLLARPHRTPDLAPLHGESLDRRPPAAGASGPRPHSLA